MPGWMDQIDPNLMNEKKVLESEANWLLWQDVRIYKTCPYDVGFLVRKASWLEKFLLGT